MSRQFILILTLFSFTLACFHSGKDTDPEFKKVFDAHRAVYSELYRRPFEATGLPSIYGQLPIRELQTGDIILRLMAGASSILTSFSNLGGYSHVGIIVKENGSLCVVDCQPHNAPVMGGHCIKSHKLFDWVQDMEVRGDTSKVLSVLVLRCQESFSKTEMMFFLRSYLDGPVQFDSQFELDNDLQHKKMLYCSEFIYVIFKSQLGHQDFIFYSDPVTNQLILRIRELEQENLYPEFIRMLHVIEDRFQVNIHTVHRLVAPSAFEYSMTFHPICFARHPQLHESGYLPLLKMYAYMQRMVIVAKSLHGLPVHHNLEAEYAYAGLKAEQKRLLRRVTKKASSESGTGYFDGNLLIQTMLCELAGARSTFDMAGNAIKKLNPPEDHGN